MYSIISKAFHLILVFEQAIGQMNIAKNKFIFQKKRQFFFNRIFESSKYLFNKNDISIIFTIACKGAKLYYEYCTFITYRLQNYFLGRCLFTDEDAHYDVTRCKRETARRSWTRGAVARRLSSKVARDPDCYSEWVCQRVSARLGWVRPS